MSRRQRASARRLRDATRASLRDDLSTHERKRTGRGWRKPLVVTADGSWPGWFRQWGSWLFLAAFIFVYFVLKMRLLGLTLVWAPLLAAKLRRGSTLELSKDGVRLLRARPRRIVPWSQVAGFEAAGDSLHFDEVPESGSPIRHLVQGIPTNQRFRAHAIFRAQTAASVFD